MVPRRTRFAAFIAPCYARTGITLARAVFQERRDRLNQYPVGAVHSVHEGSEVADVACQQVGRTGKQGCLEDGAA